MPDSMPPAMAGHRVGVLMVGVGGAVASTAAAGLERLRAGSNDRAGLPLADITGAGLADYRDLHVAGWDLHGADLATAADQHRVVPPALIDGVRDGLAATRPWAGIGNRSFCRNIEGGNTLPAMPHRQAVDRIRSDIRAWRDRTRLQSLVMINLASTESWPEDRSALADPGRFERALDRDDPSISPAMLYAYSAIVEGIPYGNFTPSLAADTPALASIAEHCGVPVAGKDGKTGQTFLKTVLAPAFRDRALRVEGWFSTNILGNRDGFALHDPDSLRSKLRTKGSVLDDILGYAVEDHLVDIAYYRPRGDEKEAWDNIDISGFLGQRMQIKINFLGRDSILAAPMVIELARCLDLAARRGEAGIQEQLGLFFKAPSTRDGHRVEHAVPEQYRNLMEWLGN
jgi:myo-inositol-1-phosphate synthase